MNDFRSYAYKIDLYVANLIVDQKGWIKIQMTKIPLYSISQNRKIINK